LIRPSRYSFFHGLKNVLNINEREKTPKKVLFKAIKNFRIFFGDSRYQNFRMLKGRNKKSCIGSTISVGIFEANCN